MDALLIGVSVVVAVALVWSGVLPTFLASLGGGELLSSFIAGLFFTSVFTTAPAIAALGEIAQVYPPVFVAGIGALGAVLGDLVIFRFMRDRFGDHLNALLRAEGLLKRTHTLLHRKFFRYFTFLVGGLIIASPLPDELGVSLLGFSKARTSFFLLTSYTFNFIGIFLIGTAARLL